MTTPDNHHRLTVEIDKWGTHRKFACSAPVGAVCRRTCTEGCESWDDTHEHEMKDSGHCLILEWLENDDAPDELFSGGSYEIFDGPIKMIWNGDCYNYELIAHEPSCNKLSHDIALDRGATFCAECGVQLAAVALPSSAIQRAVARIAAITTEREWSKVNAPRALTSDPFIEGLKSARRTLLER